VTHRRAQPRRKKHRVTRCPALSGHWQSAARAAGGPGPRPYGGLRPTPTPARHPRHDIRTPQHCAVHWLHLHVGLHVGGRWAAALRLHPGSGRHHDGPPPPSLPRHSQPKPLSAAGTVSDSDRTQGRPGPRQSDRAPGQVGPGRAKL
jgi:hypothetical protein